MPFTRRRHLEGLARPARCALCVLLFLATPARLLAAWELVRVDTGQDSGHVHLDGDLVAFEKEEDIYLYRISTGETTRLTQDGPHPVDLPVALVEGVLWYWSYEWSGSTRDLFRYDLQGGQPVHQLTTDSTVPLLSVSADPERIVLLLDGEWWAWDQEELRQLTYTGSTYTKQDPWLSGGRLYWRGGDSPDREIHLSHVPGWMMWTLTADHVDEHALWVHGAHAAWVRHPAEPGGAFIVDHHDSESWTEEEIGTSYQATRGQVSIWETWVVWLGYEAARWRVRTHNLETGHTEEIHSTALPAESVRVAGDDIAFITRHCPSTVWDCFEVNACDRRTGATTQVTHFGSSTTITDLRLEPGRMAFHRTLNAFPFTHEVYVALKRPAPVCGALGRTGEAGGLANLGLLLLPPGLLFLLRRLPAPLLLAPKDAELAGFFRRHARERTPCTWMRTSSECRARTWRPCKGPGSARRWTGPGTPRSTAGGSRSSGSRRTRSGGSTTSAGCPSPRRTI